MALNQPVAISLGFVGVYIVPAGDGCVLVDSGVPGQEDRIFAGMARYGLEPESIRLIFITHAHGDHMGSMKAIAERTHAPVLAHRIEAPALASGNTLSPSGLTAFGRIASRLMGRFVKAASGFPYPPDIVVDDERSLTDFGLNGRAIHTPGHTAGSLTLLLDSGEAFVGDLCAKFPLIGGGSYVPFFGEDREAVYRSWERLLAEGATRIYPDHGPSFPASALRAELTHARR